MIRTPTTFVIGAGASKPYGLPTGRELRNSACEFKAKTDLYQLVQGVSQKPEQLTSFLEDLRGHTAKSIDAYLLATLKRRR